MTASAFNDRPGELSDGSTLRIQRRLPGSLERVWSYLTDSALRQRWLASGAMQMQAGSSFELVWRNDELSASATERPEGFAAESRAVCRLEEIDPPHRMRYVWPDVGEVTFELEAIGDDVLLTLTHRRLSGQTLILNVCAGWHAHLALLVALREGRTPPSLWATWKRLREDYRARSAAA